MFFELRPYTTYLALGLEQNLAVIGDTRQNTLLEDHNIALVETEVVVLLKELLGGFACRSTGHDVPGDDHVLTTDERLQLENTLSL